MAISTPNRATRAAKNNRNFCFKENRSCFSLIIGESSDQNIYPYFMYLQKPNLLLIGSFRNGQNKMSKNGQVFQVNCLTRSFFFTPTKRKVPRLSMQSILGLSTTKNGPQG
jgi:hypothetical protein